MEDWDKVTIIGKRAQTGQQLKSKSALNAAGRNGGSIVSEKKTGINSVNKGPEGSKIAKADRDTDVCILSLTIPRKAFSKSTKSVQL